MFIQNFILNILYPFRNNRGKSIFDFWFFKLLKFIIIYSIWIFFIKLLALTVITYFTASPYNYFQEINESFSSNEINLIGFSAFLFVLLTHWINPLSEIKILTFLNHKHFEKEFFPGFFRGSFIASFLIFFFILTGFYNYVGNYLYVDGSAQEIINVLIRIFSIVLLVYSEEFIFRKKLKSYFPKKIPLSIVAHITAILYCFIKTVQFELSFFQLLTLYLVSILLSYRMEKNQSFSSGAGYWAAILVIFHPLLSLPIFGNGFSGILLVKCIPFALTQNEFLPYHPHFFSNILSSLYSAYSSYSYSKDTLTRWITGGAGGPLSSLSFQILVIADLFRDMIIIKKVNS